MSAALVLDIDGTIDTANPKEVDRLVTYTDKHGVNRYVNTARSQAYCRDPGKLTTDIVGPKSHGTHYCLVHPDPPVSKVMNMEKIARRERIDNSKCLVLIDDRPENIEAVKEAGFSAIQVNAHTGIRKRHVNRAQRLLRRCLIDKKSRGTCDANVSDDGFLRRVLLRLVIVIAILLLLGFLMRI